MMKKTLLILSGAALALVVAGDAFAAIKKKRPAVRNNVQVWSTSPDLPADVPYTNTRNRDWLGGYVGGGENNCIGSAGNNMSCLSASPQPQPRRNWRDRRWRRSHNN